MYVDTQSLYFFTRVEMKEYLPPREGLNVNVEEIHSFCLGQVVGMQSLSPEDAKIKFIGGWYLLALLSSNPLSSPSLIVFL